MSKWECRKCHDGDPCMVDSGFKDIQPLRCPLDDQEPEFARATKTLGCNAHNGAQPLKCKGNPPCEDISVICIYHKTCPDFQPFKE